MIGHIKNIGQVTIISLAFLLIFTAFGTCQNFASKIMKLNGFRDLGNISLAMLYLFFAFGGFFSTAIINRIKSLRLSLCLAGLSYSSWIICFIPPSLHSETNKEEWPMLHSNACRKLIQVSLILSAMINGLGAGILWVSQGKFISICASDSNRGFINAYFWMIFMSS